MTLDVLVFTLGVLVAGLLALAALPAVWRRALRLSEERLSRLVPLSAEEVAAERDHLRAAHAVEVRRIEQKLERAEAAAAALKVEAGRREGRIARLDVEIAQAQGTVTALEAERAALRREVAGLWAEAGAEAVALRGLSALADRRLDEIAALQATRDALVHDIDRSRGSLAALETRLVGTETRNEDLQRALAQARREVVEARDAATAAARQDLAPVLAQQGHDIEALRTELAFMAEQAASAERRATEATKAAEALSREKAAGEIEAGDEEARLRRAIAALADEVMKAAPRPVAPV